MTDTGISKCLSCGQEMHGTDYLDLLRRELAEARNLLVAIREAMIIQGSNQRITDWKFMIAAIDAARREKP